MPTPQPESPDLLDVTRRRFFTLATVTLAALGGLVFGVPLIGALLGPAWRTKKRHFVKVAEIVTLPIGQPVDLTFAAPTANAYVQETILHSVWAVKHSETTLAVYSPLCPHLGCQYAWDEPSQHFQCPCHGSVFAVDGRVLAGPAPRPLDALPTKIANGALYVEWERFKLGIPQKIAI